jgi:hypothetical protein
MVKTVSAAGDGTSLTPDTFIEVDHHRELSFAHGTASLVFHADVNEAPVPRLKALAFNSNASRRTRARDRARA